MADATTPKAGTPPATAKPSKADCVKAYKADTEKRLIALTKGKKVLFKGDGYIVTEN